MRERAEKFITSDILDTINNNCKHSHSIPKYNLSNDDDSSLFMMIIGLVVLLLCIIVTIILPCYSLISNSDSNNTPKIYNNDNTLSSGFGDWSSSDDNWSDSD